MPGSAYRPGNYEDFGRLYRETYRRVLFTLHGILRDSAAAEDCTQEAYVRAFRAWPSWKPDAPAEAWVHRIAVNVAISYRRRERIRALADRLQRHDAVQPADPGRLDLMDALRRLKPHHAAVIVLRHHHGYSNREIAAALGMPESTVSAQLASAKRQLVKLLGEPVNLRLEGSFSSNDIR
jgi:RNA polymerase sigma-70 factor (ECF subfamily)